MFSNIRLVRITGNINPARKKDLMKSIVKLIEKKNELPKEAEELQTKMEFFENTKQFNEIEHLAKYGNQLQNNFVAAIRREHMLLSLATPNKDFIYN